MAEIKPNPVIEGEKQTAEANPTDFELARDEATKTRARSLGWKPKTEWEGDPGDWRPAREFVDRQSLFDKIRSVKDENFGLKRDNTEMKRDLQVIRDYVKQMSEIEFKRAVAQLNDRKAEAVADANVQEVKRIDGEIDQLKETRIEVKAENIPSGPPPEFTAWQDKNKWYNEDTELRAQADEFGYGILAKNKGMPIDEVLRQVEVKVKKMYPEKFPTTNVRRTGTAAVEAGGVTNSGLPRGKGKLSESDLDDVQKKAMSAFVARGILTKEQYLDSLAKQMGMK